MSDEYLAEIEGDLEVAGANSSFLIGSQLLAIAARMLAKHGCDNREFIQAAIMRAYEQHIVPIDLPGVPNIVEPAFDRRVGEALEQGLTLLANNLCGD